MNNPNYIVFNGLLEQEADVSISPANRGTMYGDGCFETIRSYSGKFLGWDQHFSRLLGGLNYLEMDAAFSEAALKQQILQLLAKNNLAEKEAMIRIQCWREGGRGYTTSSRKMNWMIQSTELHSTKKPLNVAIAQTRCIPSVALLRKYKLSNGLNYIKAAQEAGKSQCEDALMLTVDNKISETTSANIFWFKNEKLFTPSIDCDLLPGVTRSFVMEVIRRAEIALEEGRYELEHIMDAEAVFCTNSLIEILEVETMSPKQIGGSDGEVRFNIQHPVVIQVKKAFQELKNQELST